MTGYLHTMYRITDPERSRAFHEALCQRRPAVSNADTLRRIFSLMDADVSEARTNSTWAQ